MASTSPARKGSSERHRSAWAATYDRTPFHELPWYSPDPDPGVVDAVRDGFLPRGSAVLDIGCGAGSNVLFLARSGLEAHGIDVSPGAIRAAEKRAREAGVRATFRAGDALNLREPAGRFAAVTDIGCFHTLPIRRRPEYVAEVARVLGPEGHYFLSWVAREHTAERGPPHRPSLAEVADVFEPRFLVISTRFHAPDSERSLSYYTARMVRRTGPQPPRR